MYHIVGRDCLGPVDILRRFKDFNIFREMLFSRYPGLCIPPIPQKKIQGKFDQSFVEERRYFLEQFLKAICDQSFLACCPEMQVFMRPQGLVAQSFKSLETVTTSHVIKFYLIKLPFSRAPETIGEIQLVQMNETINKFVKD